VMHFSLRSKRLKVLSWWKLSYCTHCKSWSVASTSLLLWNMPKWDKCVYVHGDCFNKWDQWNKRATFVVVMTCYLIFVT